MSEFVVPFLLIVFGFVSSLALLSWAGL